MIFQDITLNGLIHVAISEVMEINSKHLRMDLKESKESSSREKIKRHPSLRDVFLYFYRLWILHSEGSRTVFMYKIKFISSIQSTMHL